jgi:hypothetical protein
VGGTYAGPTGGAIIQTAKMLGLGSIASGVITPTKTGTVCVWITFTANNSAGAGVVLAVQGLFGTGTPPVYAAATSGTAFGEPKAIQNAAVETVMLMAKVTGLTLNTAYWFDCSMQAQSSGNVAVKDVDIILMEV